MPQGVDHQGRVGVLGLDLRDGHVHQHARGTELAVEQVTVAHVGHDARLERHDRGIARRRLDGLDVDRVVVDQVLEVDDHARVARHGREGRRRRQALVEQRLRILFEFVEGADVARSALFVADDQVLCLGDRIALQQVIHAGLDVVPDLEIPELQIAHEGLLLGDRIDDRLLVEDVDQPSPGDVRDHQPAVVPAAVGLDDELLPGRRVDAHGPRGQAPRSGVPTTAAASAEEPAGDDQGQAQAHRSSEVSNVPHARGVESGSCLSSFAVLHDESVGEFTFSFLKKIAL